MKELGTVSVGSLCLSDCQPQIAAGSWEDSFFQFLQEGVPESLALGNQNLEI